jgi:NAD(P)-dependent dehydrogenase (short-subunit alcohol dehydrogenase family)
MSELAGQVALVSGAASGIGAAIARRLRAAGAKVASIDLSEATDCDVRLRVDLRDEAATRAAYDDTARTLGTPNILVHAAAKSVRGGSLDSSASEYLEIYDVNVVGAVRLMRCCVPAMRAQRGGSILMISSINAAFATPTLAAYSASKAALENLAKTAALEFASDGIRVNAIAPASIDTPMLPASFAHEPNAELAKQRNIARHPLGRLGTAAEVAELALFLVSQRAGWITGSVYSIDGGASVTRR